MVKAATTLLATAILMSWAHQAVAQSAACRRAHAFEQDVLRRTGLSHTSGNAHLAAVQKCQFSTLKGKSLQECVAREQRQIEDARDVAREQVLNHCR
jgi:predicted metal-binding membrane protein